jgi:hypothetical protein
MKKYPYMAYPDARRRLPNAEVGAAEINMPFPPLETNNQTQNLYETFTEHTVNPVHHGTVCM